MRLRRALGSVIGTAPLPLRKVATMRGVPAREDHGEDGIWSETPQWLAEKRFACGEYDLAINTLVEARDVEKLVWMATQIDESDGVSGIRDVHRCFDAAEAVLNDLIAVSGDQADLIHGVFVLEAKRDAPLALDLVNGLGLGHGEIAAR